MAAVLGLVCLVKSGPPSSKSLSRPRVLLSLSKYSLEVTSGAAKDTRSLRPLRKLGADWLRRRRIERGRSERVCGDEGLSGVDENAVRSVDGLAGGLEDAIVNSAGFGGRGERC